MLDPAAASAMKAGSSAMRALSTFRSRPGIRLGSREERREVYARFLSATVTAMSTADHMQFQWTRYPWFMSTRAINKLEDMRHNCQVEVMQAYIEMRLVANPKPLERADAVLSALDLLINCTKPKESRKFDVAQERMAEAQRRMVEACRDDLWYLPKWWHLWRPAWWSARWVSLRGRKPMVIGGNPPSS